MNLDVDPRFLGELLGQDVDRLFVLRRIEGQRGGAGAGRDHAEPDADRGDGNEEERKSATLNFLYSARGAEPFDHGFSVNKGAPSGQEWRVKLRNDSI